MDLTNIVTLITTYAPYTVGVIMPPIVSIILKDIPKDKDGTRVLFTVAVCSLVAAALNLSKLQAGDVNSFFTSLGLIFTEANIVYKTYFNNSTLNQLINPNVAVSTQTPTAQELDPNTAP